MNENDENRIDDELMANAAKLKSAVKPARDLWPDIEKAINYIRRGLDELLAGKPLSTPTSQPYGCGIKYKG